MDAVVDGADWPEKQQHKKAPAILAVIELWSEAVIGQKTDYIYNNPVEAGFVSEPEHWKHSQCHRL